MPHTDLDSLPLPESRETYFLGVDPGASTGLCCYLPHGRNLMGGQVVATATLPFWEAWDWSLELLDRLGGPDAVTVIVEDPNKISPVFPRQGASKSELAKAMNVAQKVGMNKRDAKLWIAGLRRPGYVVLTKAPGQGRGTAGGSKWTMRDVVDRLGDGEVDGLASMSEHVRDALSLCWSMTGSPSHHHRLQEAGFYDA